MPQLVSNALRVINLFAFNMRLSVKNSELLLKLMDALMGLVLFSLELLAKLHLFLQVVLKLFDHVGSAIALTLQSTEPLDGFSARNVGLTYLHLNLYV